VIRLRGGPHGQDLEVSIDDPGLRIARITVELYQKPYDEAAARTQGEPAETLIVEQNPKVCPPSC
jgi:hypothetical protein